MTEVGYYKYNENEYVSPDLDITFDITSTLVL